MQIYKGRRQKSQKMKNYLRSNLQDFFFVGQDQDGYRMYRVNLDVNVRTPVRQRYDRYVGLLGQVHDIESRLKDLWGQYLEIVERQDQEKNGNEPEEESGDPA